MRQSTVVVVCCLFVAIASAALRDEMVERAIEQQKRLLELERMFTDEVSPRVKFLKHPADSRSDEADQIALQTTTMEGGSSCQNAALITLGGTVTGDTSSGGSPSGTPSSCGDANLAGTKALWFKVPPGTRGTVYATTCGTSTKFDTQLSVVSGSCGSGTMQCERGADDDIHCSVDSSHSTVQFTAKEDTQYYILVHGYKSETGPFQLTVGVTRSRAMLDVNLPKHQTDKYRAEDGTPNKDFLVVRRDNPFDISVESPAAVSRFVLQLYRDSAPADGNRELEIPAVSPTARMLSYTMNDLWAMPVDKKGHAITWRFRLPANTPIGQFALRIDYVGGISTYLYEDVVVIFNPLSANDDVYVQNQADRDEYVFNEFGAVFKGSADRPFWIPWAYDQFNMVNLITTNNLLTGTTLAQRRSPVYISRRLTSRLNSNSKGLLTGNWGTDFSGGRRPGEWADSTDIFTMFTYAGTKQRMDKSVKYGQCWVFASVFTTALRAIGIASRPVSNFGSAHEAAPYDQNVDFFYRENPSTGAVEADSKTTRDSIWNFHVWTEAFFRRKDIDSGDGWQAVDATPQEKSRGPAEAPFSARANQCGPASIARIAAGDVKSGFDADFVAGEVNARTRNYLWNKNTNKWDLAGVRPDDTGIKILTKGPDSSCGSVSRESNKAYKSICTIDLRATGHYKRKLPASSTPDLPVNAMLAESNLAVSSQLQNLAEWDWVKKLTNSVSEGFKSIGRAVANALKIKKQEQARDIVFDKSYPDAIIVGQDVEFKFTAKSASSKEYSGKMVISISSVTYTGKFLSTIKHISEEVKVASGDKQITLTVAAKDYQPFLAQSSYIRVVFSALLSGGQSYVSDEVVLVPPPPLKLECPDSVSTGSKITCKITFVNPLDKELKNLKFHVHLTGHAANQDKEPKVASIGPKATYTSDIVVEARNPGAHAVITVMSGGGLHDVEATERVQIVGAPRSHPDEKHNLQDPGKKKIK